MKGIGKNRPRPIFQDPIGSKHQWRRRDAEGRGRAIFGPADLLSPAGVRRPLASHIPLWSKGAAEGIGRAANFQGVVQRGATLNRLGGVPIRKEGETGLLLYFFALFTHFLTFLNILLKPLHPCTTCIFSVQASFVTPCIHSCHIFSSVGLAWCNGVVQRGATWCNGGATEGPSGALHHGFSLGLAYVFRQMVQWCNGFYLHKTF